MTEYFARKEYIYTTGDTIFSIPFSYIKKEHIKVLINDEETTQYTYLNDTQIRITQELLLGDVVVIVRNTPIDDKFVTFTDTSILSSKQQNLSQDQMFNAVQEIYDGNVHFEIETNKTLDENKEELEGIIEDNKQELLTIVAENKAETLAIANNALDVANVATNTANSAVNTANEAEAKADTAINTADLAAISANNAVDTANNANAKSDESNVIANNAINTAESAVTTAGNALTTANNAVDIANGAVATANSAETKVDEFGEDIQIVIEAAEKIQELEGAVVEAKEAAAEATIAADSAVEAAEAAIGALDSKQDKFTVGTGLALENGVLSNTQTSAEWGNITGTIDNQTDLIDKFNVVDERIEELQTSKLPNATIIGTPNIEGSYVSGFSESNYLQFPFVDISQGLPFDIYFPFTTGANITTQQNILDSYFGIALAIQNGKGVMALSSNGTSWDIGVITGTYNLQPNTTYYAKLSWTGTQYTTALSTDGKTYTTDMTVNSNLTTHKTTIYIGASPNLFGVGTSHPFLGTINFNGAKVIVDNIEAWDGYADIGFQTRANVSLSNLDEAGEAKIRNSAYHPPLLSCMWSDHLINDIQWLRADTFSWQDGDVYKSVYEELVSEYNNEASVETTLNNIKRRRTPKGYKITTAEYEQAVIDKYNSQGIAWFYIIDVPNKRFKLPRTKFGFEGLRGAVGDDIAESLPNITGTTGSVVGGASGKESGAFLCKEMTGAMASVSTNTWNTTFDASRSSSTYKNGAPVQERATQMYLYFYVGEYTREAIEQTAGITTEQLNAKVDINSSWGFPSNRYIDLELGASGTTYTAPANGWVCIAGTTTNGFYQVHDEIFAIFLRSGLSGGLTSMCFPVKKGQQFKVGINAITQNFWFKFIYAEGSN